MPNIKIIKGTVDKLTHPSAGQRLFMDEALKGERQHVESRAIRRVFGITLTADPYLNGLTDGTLYLIARGLKMIRKAFAPHVKTPRGQVSSDRNGSETGNQHKES